MKYNNYSGVPFEMQLWKVSSKASIASDFATLLRIKQGEKLACVAGVERGRG